MLKEYILEKRRKILLISLPFVILIIVALSLTKMPQPVSETSPSLPSPPEVPQNILVTPEVPLGTIAIVLSCLLALMVAHIRSKDKST